MKMIITSGLMLLLLCLININEARATAGKKVLVVYFSYSGNTRAMAKQIQNVTQGDIFELQTVQAYSTDYDTAVKQAQQEIADGYQPELKSKLTNLQDYDVVFIGSPCWWGTIAPAVHTFLSSYDLAGKTIVPFMTHEGSGLGHSVNDIKKYAPKSTVLDGLAIRGRSVNSSQAEVNKWVKGLKF